MLGNIKIKFMKEMNVYELPVFVHKALNKINGRLFFIDERDGLEDNYYTAMELIKEDDFYKVCPVYIEKSEEGKVVNIMPLHNKFVNGRTYYIYWKDLFNNFVSEICENIIYEPKSLIKLMKEIIEEHQLDYYYFTDGVKNEFYVDVLNLFTFKGKLYSGIGYVTVIMSDLSLMNNLTSKVITELPDVNLNGAIKIGEEDNEPIFVEYLRNTNLNGIIPYINESIEKFISK